MIKIAFRSTILIFLYNRKLNNCLKKKNILKFKKCMLKNLALFINKILIKIFQKINNIKIFNKIIKGTKNIKIKVFVL